VYAYKTRRPLVGFAITYALGLQIGYECNPPLTYSLVGCVASLYITWRSIRYRSKTGYYLVLFTVALLQVSWITREVSSGSSRMHEMRIIEEQPVCLRGSVSLAPTFHPTRNEHQGRWHFQIAHVVVESHPEVVLDSMSQVRVSVFGWSNDLLPLRGEEVLVEGKWSTAYFPGSAAHNLYLSSLHQLRRSPKSVNSSIKKAIEAWRKKALHALSSSEKRYQDQAAIYKALVLGARNELPTAWKETFRRCGCMHIFSISGLHVGILTLLLSFLLKTVGVSIRWMGLLIIPFLFLFCWVTGLRPSAIRATCMASVYLVGLLCKRMPDVPNCVALTALLMLLSHPLYVADIGFIYSFVIVAYILLGFAALPDRWRQQRGMVSYLLMLGFSSLIANIISIPLSLYYFSEATWMGLLSNIVVIPLTFVIVLCGWVSLLMPPLASFYNQAAYYQIDGLMFFLQRMEQIAHPWQLVNSPTYPSLLLWLVSIAVICLYRGDRMICVGGVFGVIIALLLFTL
jgi:ComEC/Rec2-related protein